MVWHNHFSYLAYHILGQSFDKSDGEDLSTNARANTPKEATSPDKASEADKSKITTELTTILKDPANDNMSFGGLCCSDFDRYPMAAIVH